MPITVGQANEVDTASTISVTSIVSDWDWSQSDIDFSQSCWMFDGYNGCQESWIETIRFSLFIDKRVGFTVER